MYQAGESMDIIRLTYPFTDSIEASPQTLAIGFFDGVHRGHQEVLREAVSLSKKEGIKASVMTFEPHPRKMLGGHDNWKYITPLQEKLARLAECGLDRCYILDFTKELSQLSPEQFVQSVLFPLHVNTVIVGFNFTFGHLGRGNTEMLRELGKDRMKVRIVKPYHDDGIKISSTLIREQIHQGQIEGVNHLLGRPYSIKGKVVPGFGRGRTIGIPTANIEPNERFVIPGNGVYAIRAYVGHERYDGVMNIGIKPTFENDPDHRTLEAHLLGFDRMIYDETIQVELIALIRHERKFAGVDELVVQINSDIQTAAAILSR
jgi:riboflavin kinase / FMN adenylyltransferase